MMSFGYSGFGIILMILFWAVIIVVAVWVLSKLFPQVTSFTAPPSNGKRSEPAENPLDILKQRYARGELNQTQYDEMRRKLLE
ncbi:MAG: SHOCT domain-containing protein [Anaerolineae bacterium]